MRHNDGLQLRRAISIQAEGKKLLEKHAYRAVSCKALLCRPRKSYKSHTHAITSSAVQRALIRNFAQRGKGFQIRKYGPRRRSSIQSRIRAARREPCANIARPVTMISSLGT